MSCIMLAAAGQACTSASSSVTSTHPAASATPAPVTAVKPSTKVDSELRALYEAYGEARQRGVDFHSNNPLLRVVDDRVVIDATAATDTPALEADLVALGLRDAAAFGRIVSGQLPISAIPALDTLESVAFVRAATMRLSPDRVRCPAPSIHGCLAGLQV